MARKIRTAESQKIQVCLTRSDSVYSRRTYCSIKLTSGAPSRNTRNARMRVITLKSPRTLYGPLFLLNMPLYRSDLKLPEIMQSASHLYGAALFARKDRVSGNIIFNRRTHRYVTCAKQ